MEAQPKPPWAKKRGGLVVGEEGSARRSSRGPSRVATLRRVMPAGRGGGDGGLGEGARHWRAKGPKGIAGNGG